MEVLGLDIEIIFFLLLLGYKHPKEVNLRDLMTSFPAFLNKAPSPQQEAGPARHSGWGGMEGAPARAAAQAFPTAPLCTDPAS